MADLSIGDRHMAFLENYKNTKSHAEQFFKLERDEIDVVLEQKKINTQEIFTEIKQFEEINKIKLRIFEKYLISKYRYGDKTSYDEYNDYLNREKYKNIDKIMNKFI